jgi:hypothetical protein
MKTKSEKNSLGVSPAMLFKTNELLILSHDVDENKGY